MNKDRKAINSRKWRRENAGYDRSYTNDRKAQVKAEKLRRGRCVDCGLEVDADNYQLFDFDHRDPARKKDALSKLVKRGSPAVVATEMAKCDLRCALCHRARSLVERHHQPRPQATVPPEGTLF